MIGKDKFGISNKFAPDRERGLLTESLLPTPEDDDVNR